MAGEFSGNAFFSRMKYANAKFQSTFVQVKTIKIPDIMKANILIILVFNLLSLCAFSQQKNITGPKAKNRKNWVGHNFNTQIILKNHDHKPVTGPKAKNSYSKKDDCDTYQFMPFERIIVTGPKFKNQQFKNSNPKKEDPSFFINYKIH